MSRLIDADALIKFIDNRYDITWKHDYEGGIKDACTDILEEINKMPTIEPQQWIPCSERLPEVYEAGNSVSGMFMQSRPVLVYGVPEHESEHGFHVVTYCDDLNGITYWSTELDAVTINEVIAWMPLPEPYKSESEG